MKKLILGLTLLVTLTAPAFAQWAVFDASNFANTLKSTIQLQQQIVTLTSQLNTLRQSYDQYVRQYQFFQNQAQQLRNMPQQYRAQFSNWQQFTVPNTYGNTGSFATALNTGNSSAVTSAYKQMTSPLQSYNGALTGYTQQDEKNRQALLDASDGINKYSLQTLGDIRQKSEAAEKQIEALEKDSLSSSNDLNTQIAVLNKINAALIIQIRSQQDANKLLVALLAQETQRGMMMRETDAQDLNNGNRAQDKIKELIPTETPEQK